MDNSYNNYSQSYTPSPPIITDEPSYQEKKKIRKLYNGVGGAMIAQYILGYLFFYIAYFTLVFVGLIIESNADGGTTIIGFWELTVMCCTPALGSIVMFYIYHAIHKTNTRELFSTKNVTVPFVLKAIAITFLLHEVGMLLQYGVAIILSIFNLDTPNLNYELAHDIPTTAMDVVTSIILAPIAEEMFFRGVVLKGLSKVSQRFAIVISALAFGLMHGNPYQAVMASLVGLALGYITIKTSSIIPAIICHMAMNTMATIPEVLSYGNDSLYDSIYYICAAIEIAVGIIGLVVVLRQGNVKFPPYTNYHKRRAMPILITSAGMIIIFILYLYDICTSVEPIAEDMETVETALRAVFRL